MAKKPYRAVTEWRLRAGRIAGAKPVAFRLTPAGSDKYDASLGSDGYAVSTGKSSVKVTANTPRGLLYGAYHLIDATRQAGNRFVGVNVREAPDYRLRMVWSWSRLDNTYLHSPYLALPSVLSGAALGSPESSPEIMRFIRHLASMRVNALALTYDLHTGGLPRVDQHAYRPFYRQLGGFARYMDEWGVDLYLYTSATPEKDFYRTVKQTDCPFDPDIELYWESVIDEFAHEMPELRGLVVAGGLGGYSGRGLYGCACEYCRGRTPTDKIRRQIGLIAGLLAGHGKKLVYDLTTDNPDFLYREVEVALTLADSLPENVIISFKNHFQDFEELRYPEHPLLTRLPKRESLPVAAEMQLFPEMRGKGLILSNVSEIWREEAERLRGLGAAGIIGVTETHPDDAHPSMAEWHVWGRLAWNARRGARELLAEWTRMNYPAGVDAILPDLLLHSYMAASNTVYAGGLQCAAHGMLCPSPQFLKHAMNETWYRANTPAPFDELGVGDEPLYLYGEGRRSEIEQNPRMFLLTKAHRLTPSVYDRLMREKDAAVAQYAALLAQWRTAEPLFEPGDYRYRALAEMLAKNAEDARRFRACLSLFWRFHMGVLTEAEIDGARAELTGPHEMCSINTCDESVALFLERLRMTLLGIPFDARFNNMTDLPQIAVPGWEEGAVR